MRDVADMPVNSALLYISIAYFWDRIILTLQQLEIESIKKLTLLEHEQKYQN